MADLEGTLETCGCTPGSLASIDRLSAAIASARSGNRTSIVIAFGRLFGAAGAPRAAARHQNEQRSTELVRALLPRMGLDIVAPAMPDMLAPRLQLNALQSAGIDILASAVRSTLRRVGSISVGVVSAVSDASPLSLGDEITRLRGAGAQLTLVVAGPELHAHFSELSSDANAPDVVLVPGDATTAPLEQLLGRTRLVRVPTHARGLAVIDLPSTTMTTATAALHTQVSQVTLTEDSPGDPLLRAELTGLFARINQENAKLGGSQPGAAATNPSFVGSATCAACHTAAYLWWRETRHARAFATLERRGRQLDLDCMGCHVTGFDQPGGATPGAHEHLEGVGCESCHGPGGAHANNPQRARSIVRAVEANTCSQCHDAERSAGFDYRIARTQLLTAAHGGAASPGQK